MSEDNKYEYNEYTASGTERALKNLFDDAFEQGVLEGRERTAVQLVRLGKLSLQEIATVCDIKLKRVQELLPEA